MLGEGIWIMSILIGGTASILGGLNFLVTILKMRVPSMSLTDMPLFCWAMIATSLLILISTPGAEKYLLARGFDFARV